MRRPLRLLALLAVPVAPAFAQQVPQTRTVAVVDTLFGMPVPDPYHWLEALDAPEVQAWFGAQAAYARSRLDALPGHAAILERLRLLDAAAPPEVSLPREAGGRWFYTMRRAGEALPRGYVRDIRTGEERLLVDPATVATGGGAGANRLATFVPSPDGRLVLYGITSGGSERVVLRVREVASGRDLDGEFRNQWDETAWWDPGGLAFYYWQLAEPAPGALTPLDFDVRMVRHRMGTDPGADAVVLSAGLLQEIEPPWMPLIDFHPRDTLALGHAAEPHSAWYRARAADVAAGVPAWRPLFGADDSVGAVIPRGSDLYVLTRKGTPRIVRTSRVAPDLTEAETLMAAAAGVTLQYMGAARDGLYVQWYSEGVNRLTRIPWGGRPVPVELPLGTSIQVSERFGSQVRVDAARSGALITLVSWTAAPRHYRYHPETGEFEDLPLSPAVATDRLTGYVAETLFAPSHDGVRVPLTVVRPERLARDGSLPVVLEVYAAYGETDFHESTPSPWFDAGGAWAICHARGGGYYGEAWHRAGRTSSKPNSWLDFIACAEQLVREGYTRPERLVAAAGSAGGITVGRAITERPDLVAGAFISNGTLDAVGQATTPVGRANALEFGSIEAEEGFRALLAMSPYHHVRAGTPYPSVMLWAGLEDIRVPPWESAKMAAALQAASSSDNPVLLRVQQAGGHISGALPATEARLRVADTLAFFMTAVGLPPYRSPAP